MTDYQTIVDELRIALENEGTLFESGVAPTAEFLDLVAQYRSFCQDCNRRLRKCEDALKKGLRSEALHQAEQSPNLLDLVATLDFPEREQLGDILSAHQLPRVDALMMDTAEALDEAYALQEPLQALMNQHRLLALARSPLPTRLSVLRKLADHDTTALHWSDDIVEMERARFAEIDQMTQAALRERNYDLLKDLHKELTETNWREPPPETLLATIKRSAAQVVRQNAIRQLHELSPKLHDAFAALDISEARTLRDKWSKSISVSGVPEADPLIQDVEPIFHWLDDEDRRDASEKSLRSAMSALERGIEVDQLTADELLRLGNDVQKYGGLIPDNLAMRYRNRLNALQLSETRRSRAIQLAIVSVFVLIGTLIGYAVYTTNLAKENEQILATISKFIDDHNYDEARSLFDQHESRATTEDWLAVKSRLVEAEKQEDERLYDLKVLLDSIGDEVAPEEVLSTLGKTRLLARTTEEKVQIGELEEVWRKKRNEQLAALESDFRGLIKSAMDKTAELERLLDNDAADRQIDDVLNSVTDDLAATALKKRAVSKELASQADFLTSRLTAFREKRTKKRERFRLIESLTDSTLINLAESSAPAKMVKYRDILNTFDAEFPNDTLTPGFRAALPHDPLPHLKVKAEMVSRWPKSLTPSTGEDLRRRVDDCTKFLSEHAKSPDMAVVRRYLDFLKSIQRRDAADEKATIPVRQSLSKLYSLPMIGSGHVLTTKDGLQFYLPDAKTLSEGVNTFDYFNSLDGSRKKLDRSLRADAFQSLTTAAPPHAEITGPVATAVRDLEMKNWSEYHLALITKLLESKSIDPFLKYYLVLRTAKYAGLGDSLLESGLVPFVASLKEDQIDLSAAWMDPYDESANKIRKQAAGILEHVNPKAIGEIAALHERQSVEMEKLLFDHPLSVGWVSKELNGTWTLHTRWKPNEDYFLYSALPATDKLSDTPLQWQWIGRTGPQGFSLNRTNFNGITDGTIVFASQFHLNPQP